MTGKELVQVACYLTPEQHAGLKRLSLETHVPTTVYLRHAVDKLLAEHLIAPKRVSGEILGHRIAGIKKGAKR